MNQTLEEQFPHSYRLLAEPGNPPRLKDVFAPPKGQRILLAIGPEGGWNDFELELMNEKGFQSFSMGERILKTETACVAALSIIAAL